ncbi:hypothetical protein FOZ63_025311 [Perkinsus olseni]|uniref:Uncharacterized protein n=1 Tax=Perkinsus olseni TaxID=32597 RepID=A0A7J6TQY9_PEROL|nr:hypothetical protein FOZ63_025311 [Perkinsus olseni]
MVLDQQNRGQLKEAQSRTVDDELAREDLAAVEAQRACVATVEALHKELLASGTREEALKRDNKRLVHDLGVITAAYDELQHKMRRVSDAASTSASIWRRRAEEAERKSDKAEEERRRLIEKVRSLQDSLTMLRKREDTRASEETRVGNTESLRGKLRSLEEENAALRGKVDLLEEKNRRESTSTRTLRSSRKRAEVKLQEVQAENRSLRESLLLAECTTDLTGDHRQKEGSTMKREEAELSVSLPAFDWSKLS